VFAVFDLQVMALRVFANSGNEQLTEIVISSWTSAYHQDPSFGRDVFQFLNELYKAEKVFPNYARSRFVRTLSAILLYKARESNEKGLLYFLLGKRNRYGRERGGDGNKKSARKNFPNTLKFGYK